MVGHFTDANFKKEVIDSEIPVMVDFFAQWCGPCKMLAPTIEKLSGEFDGKFKLGKLDIEADEKTKDEFGIQAIPTMVFFKGGKEVDRLQGYKSEEDLRKKLNSLM